MPTSILATKLYIPPTRPELVSRPRLIEQLNEGLHRKMTLISAPAGFGKTTLVTEWLDSLRLDATKENQIENKIAWLSLDEGDNDLVRFLTYFTAALNQIEGIEATFGKGALSMLLSPQAPPIETVLTSLINEIAAISVKIILILDDYHLIEAQPIQDALSFLLENIPPQMHLVIATREDPHLPLARLRSQDQLTELRAAELRFTSSEAAEFLNQVMGLDLSVEDIAALETSTEGWIAGLQLAAISLQGKEDTSKLIRSFSGSHRLVLDYLIEEVLQQQSESVQTFLLETSILDRMIGSLCDALTGQDNGQATLEMLERSNLFIILLDEERRWYRYHHLFADLLRRRLGQAHPEQMPILQSRASEWYKKNGFTDEAIEHALRGEYFERAATLIEDQFDNYERGDQTLLRRWLAEIPEEFVFSRPRLCILHAWNLLSFGHLETADRSLQAAEKMLDPNSDHALVYSPDKDQLSDTTRMKLVGRVAAIRSFLVAYGGDIPRTIRYARQALEYLPEQELQWRSGVLITLGDAYANKGQMSAAHKARSDALVTGKASGDPYLLMIVNSRLAEILRQQGKLQQVIDICERQWKSACEIGISESVVVGWLLGIWGEVLAELNNLDKAIDQVKKGVKLTASGGDVLHEVMTNLCLVRVLFSRGDITGAQGIIQSIENSADKYDIPHRALLQLSAWQVRIWLAQGKLEAASQWARERELDPDGKPTYLHEVEYIVYARILITQGKLDEANRLLQRLIESAEMGGRISIVIEILILQSLAYQAGEDAAQAVTVLEKALRLAQPSGFIRTFVDEGPPMARLLYEALSREIAPEYVQRLLAAFPVDEPEKTGPSKTQIPKSELVEPLSEREIEVLQLIALGLTNPEIATRLFLSTHTVKVHTRNIYGKLGAHNRTEAVARARSLGIFSSI